MAASTAGSAANAKASSTNGPMPGTLRWIMNGITLMPAPTIEHTPVAVRPARPISRASRGVNGGESGIVSHRGSHSSSDQRGRRVRDHDQNDPSQRFQRERCDDAHRHDHPRNSSGSQSQRRTLMEAPYLDEPDAGNQRDAGTRPHHDRKRRPRIHPEKTEDNQTWRIVADTDGQ